jgi:hypothetical protein
MTFHETQRFRQRWMWILVIAALLPSIGITGYGVWHQIVMGVPFGDRPASDAGLLSAFALVCTVGAAILALLRSTRLDVSVNEHEVLIRFRPFHLEGRRIALSEIVESYARTYRPIVEYGGWGIRMGFNGMAYNVSGNEGVQLVLANGKRILIGSQRSHELEAAIATYKNKRITAAASATP